MKKILLVLLLVLAFSLTIFAQSGRRIAKPPAPNPISEAPEQAGYSDSIPGARLPSTVTAPIVRRSDGAVKAAPATQTPTIPAAPAGSEDGENDEEVLRVETNLVTIPVSVADRNGRYIPFLQQGDFKIFEDGKEHPVAYLGATEQPFTVVLLLDTSPSTEYNIEEIRGAAVAFVNQLKPEDQVMVVEFDENIHVLSEPTNDRNKLYKAIQKADFGGGTSLYDAIDFALHKRLSKIEGRKAIVLFTDGVDTTSVKAGYDSSINLAEKSDAIVFTVYYNTYGRNGVWSTPQTSLPPINPFPFPGIGNYPAQRPRGTTRREYEEGKKYLDELSARTGGRIYPADLVRGGLETAFAGIAEELRRQYTIGYYPENAGQPGQRRQIRVRVMRPNLVVRARDSYVVGSGDAPSETAAAPQKFN